MRSFDTPHTRRGVRYLVMGVLSALVLLVFGFPPLEISVVVGGFALIILVGIASGLVFDDVEDA